MITISVGFENGVPSITYNECKSAPVVRKRKGKSLLSFPEKYVCLDLETTGFSSQYDEIIEICAIKVESDREIDRFHTLVKPENEIDKYISELTGITNELVADAPNIKAVLPTFIEFISDLIVVGHNINFDINFIYDNCLQYLNYNFENNYVDTMRLSRKLIPELKHHRLRDLIKHFDINVEKEHRADSDCKATICCLKKLKTVAINTYGDVESALYELTKGSKKSYTDFKDLHTTANYIDIDNPFYEKNVVFTGTLEKMVRKDAAQLVVNLGGLAQNSITKKTDYLVLGNNDYCKTIKDGKSSKQKKAESLILSGSDLKIIPENVFYDIISEWINNFEQVERQIVADTNNVDVFTETAQENNELNCLNAVEERILNRVKELVDDRFLETCDIIVKENKSDYNSLTVVPQDTIYRGGSAKEKLVARIKAKGEAPYISLPGSSRKTLEEHHVSFSTVKNDDYLRIPINDFLSRNDDGIQEALNDILLSALNFPSFGCCSRFNECSEKGECIHPDILYASAACQYKKHLDNGENFYK